MNRLKILWLVIFVLPAFHVNSFGQKRTAPAAPARKVTAPAVKSLFTAKELPTGATKINAAEMSPEDKAKLASLAEVYINIERRGANLRQGISETISWAGYGSDSEKAEQLMTKIENSLRAAGWEYKSGNVLDSPTVMVSLARTKPAAREMIGFFTSENDALLFVVTELIQNTANTAKSATTTPVKKGVNVAGKWNMTAETLGQYIPVTLVLKQDGEIVSGTFSSHLGNGTIREIKVTGNTLKAIAKVQVQGRIVELDLDGVIDGNRMNGTLTGAGLPPISFEATRGN